MPTSLGHDPISISLQNYEATLGPVNWGLLTTKEATNLPPTIIVDPSSCPKNSFPRSDWDNLAPESIKSVSEQGTILGLL